MITKVEWEKLTPQQQFDYTHLLEETVDSYVDADAPVSEREQFIRDELAEDERRATKEYPAIMQEPIPHEPLPFKLDPYDGAISGYFTFPLGPTNGTSPDYRKQFLP